MKPIPFHEMDLVLGAPKDWDEATQGKCVGLPIRRVDDGCFSVWEPTPEERAIIAAGGSVTVHVFSGLTQPPIAVGARASENPEPMSPVPPRPFLRSTHTFVTLDVSQAAYDEIAGKLRAADYGHAFVGSAIDMHGIGLVLGDDMPVPEAARAKALDADRWRALLGSPYISIMGWAGFDRDMKPMPGATYMHFGINFWSEHGYTADHVKEPTERGRRILTAYADARLTAQAPAVGVTSTTTGGE